ncbi:MAG: hypothetical protein JXA42_17720 [Anaerolineales bacterium]|nr:hypothetical protein [Anaerolineales bacterium]
MLHWIDVLVIIIYLVATITIGILYRGRQQDAADYFTAGSGMGSLFQTILVGLSLAATLFSGISFMAYPSLVYTTGITILFGLAVFPAAYIILRYWFLPRFLTHEIQHPYDIIEQRFGSRLRTLSAGMYVLLRMGWMATLIYAPTLALLTAGGLDDVWFWPIVLILGVSSTVYTTLGGIRGVIITDAMQFVVIALGVVATLVFVLLRLPIPLSEGIRNLEERGLLAISFSLSPREFTIWAVIFGGCAANLANYFADQMSLQRYLATGNAVSAARSFAFNIVGATSVLFLLAGVGLSLAVWYHAVPDPNLPDQADKIFPYFITALLPTGLSGLLLAALLAATCSSMTSGINTLAATLTFDFRMRLGSPMSLAQQLRFGRISSLIIGLVATIVAGCVESLGTIFEITQIVLGLFLGPLFACIIFCLVKWRLHSVAVGIAMLAGLMAGAWVTWSPWHALWVPVVTFVGTLFLGVVLSLLLRCFGLSVPNPKTISSRKKEILE